jgi:hypothetical protein
MKRDKARLTFDVTWLGALLSALLIAACYGYALGLPFYFDDLPVLTWLEGRGLAEVWTTSSENAYYRPLTFTVYAFGLLFPKGAQQVVLHAANLVLHWIASMLVMRLVVRCTRGRAGVIEGLLAASLYAVFPFLFRAVPWVTAMPHFLVITLTLTAALAALKAVEGETPRWWAASLVASALAPFAHESGLVSGAIVGGLVVIQRGFRLGRRDVVGVLLGVLLNAGALFLRTRVPGAGSFLPDGLNSAYENAMYVLQGLVYPVGPAIGALVHRRGWHDFTLIGAATGGLILLLAWLGTRSRAPGASARDGRWIALSLWWWACGALPTALRFRYGGLVNSPRFYALSAAGIVMLWAGILVRVARLPRRAWMRWLVGGILAGALLASNVSFLWAQKDVHRAIVHVYRQILEAAEDEGNAPLGFVNVPAWLTPRDQTYALSKDGAVMLPLYTSVRQYIAVNREKRAADNVMFVHVLQEPADIYWGFHGDWLDWEQMRQFAVEHHTMWLARWEDDPGRPQGRSRFVLHYVGAIAQGEPAAEAPLARYEGGPLLEAARARHVEEGHWTVTLTWHAEGPVEANVFVHVVDASRNLVTQADGPALGGMVPLSVLRPGDRVTDVRHLALPRDGGPYTVLVGVYNAAGRLPAFTNGDRAPDDAVPVAELAP